MTSRKNKAGQATMRPDCVSACIDFSAKYVTYTEIQMDRQMKRVVKETPKTRLLITRFSIGSHRGLNQLRNAVFAQVLRTDRRIDGRTDGRTDGQTLL